MDKNVWFIVLNLIPLCHSIVWVKVFVKTVLNVFKMHQIVHKDQCVYIHHVVTVHDVNLLQVDYDPINRRLIDEENEDEKRILFIVSYSSRLQTYNTVMNTFHLYFISFRLYYSYYKEILTKIKYLKS